MLKHPVPLHQARERHHQALERHQQAPERHQLALEQAQAEHQASLEIITVRDLPLLREEL